MHDMTVLQTRPYVIAVSGGVDSVVLLDMLRVKGLPLVVAHVNHGVRADSNEDENLVRQLAQTYNLPFEVTHLSLGEGASEETARIHRYRWLEQVRDRYDAVAIVTAHHQDDVLETMLINLIRGTGWRGLCSLRNTADCRRPLLSLSKVDVVNYALEHELTWREDSTNDSMRYLRNRIRHLVIPRMTTTQRRNLVELYDAQTSLRGKIEDEAKDVLRLYLEDTAIARHPLIMFDVFSGREVLRSWLGDSLETARLDDLLLFAKVALPGAKWSLDATRFIVANKRRLIVLPPRD